VIKPQGNYGKLHKIHLELNLTYDKWKLAIKLKNTHLTEF
jgi:hypothetical protein